MSKLHAGKFAPKHRGPKWHALWIGEAYNPRVVAQAKTASGAYAIRSKATHEVFYVGESSRGTIWKTLLRHVQAPLSFGEVRETGVLKMHPSHYEVALHITSRGHRPRASSKRKTTLAKRGVAHRTDADQRATFAQARWIQNLHPTMNKDDGNSAKATEEYRAHVARQEAEDRERNLLVFNPSDVFQGGRRVGHFKSKKKAIAAGKNLVRKTGQPAIVVTPNGRPRSRERWHTGNPAPKGALTELGKLTRLEPKGGRVLRWSLREAPSLSYDAAGRLFIVYTGKIVRSSSPAELREYSRTHWGKRGFGVVRSGGVATGPFTRIGAAKSVTYTTQKGADHELVDYVHPFGEGAPAKGFLPPQIVEHGCVGGCGPRCAANGSIALHGGTYRVTSRGIVG